MGYAILSGLLTGQANDVASAYVAAGFTQSARNEIGDWGILVMRRNQ